MFNRSVTLTRCIEGLDTFAKKYQDAAQKSPSSYPTYKLYTALSNDDKIKFNQYISLKIMQTGGKNHLNFDMYRPPRIMISCAILAAIFAKFAIKASNAAIHFFLPSPSNITEDNHYLNAVILCIAVTLAQELPSKLINYPPTRAIPYLMMAQIMKIKVDPGVMLRPPINTNSIESTENKESNLPTPKFG